MGRGLRRLRRSQNGSGEATGPRVVLPDGASITWERKRNSLTANEDAALRFTVREPDGPEARLAPYLGMPGHAVVARDDGGVYIHLHPNGTVSMAAQEALGARQKTDTAPFDVVVR